MHRSIYIVIAVALLGAAGSGLTWASYRIAELKQPTPRVTKVYPAPEKPQSKPVATPAPVTVTPVVTPKPVAVEAPASPTVTTNGYVRMRAARTTGSAIVMELQGGTILNYTQVDSGVWQAVSYQGVNGFVHKSYLRYQ